MSISIDIDIDEIWDQVSNREFQTEMKHRNLENEKLEMAGFQDAIRTAIAQIRRGDTLDAITTLEREFWPKWASVGDSESALRLALFANDNKEAAPKGAVG